MEDKVSSLLKQKHESLHLDMIYLSLTQRTAKPLLLSEVA